MSLNDFLQKVTAEANARNHEIIRQLLGDKPCRFQIALKRFRFVEQQMMEMGGVTGEVYHRYVAQNAYPDIGRPQAKNHWSVLHVYQDIKTPMTLSSQAYALWWKLRGEHEDLDYQLSRLLLPCDACPDCLKSAITA